MMMFAAPRLETLELLDIGAHLWVGSALVDLLKTRSNTLRFLALRLNHQPDAPGVLDNVLEVCPHLEVLHVHADLVSPRFFSQRVPSHFRILLLGSLTKAPIVFSGNDSLLALWEGAAERWPAQTLKRTKPAAYNHVSNSSAALTYKLYHGTRQDQQSTVEGARTASEDASANGFGDIGEWMQQEMTLPSFIPAPLGPKETSEVASALNS